MYAGVRHGFPQADTATYDADTARYDSDTAMYDVDTAMYGAGAYERHRTVLLDLPVRRP